MMFASEAGICTSLAMTAGSSGMTVPYSPGVVASVAADWAVCASVGDAADWVVGSAVGGESVGVVSLVAVDSGGGVQLARMVLAASRLPVTEAINFNASRRDNLPSS